MKVALVRLRAGVFHPIVAFLWYAQPAAHHLEMTVVIGCLHSEWDREMHSQAVIRRLILNLGLDIHPCRTLELM